MNIFLDTNVLVDFILVREKFYGPAATLITDGFKKQVDITISSLTMVNANYICVHQLKFPKEDFNKNIDFLRNFISISSIDSADVYSSYDEGWKDFEDGVQYFSAKRSGCDYIVTRNIKDFKNSDLPVVDPIQMVDILYDLRQRKDTNGGL